MLSLRDSVSERLQGVLNWRQVQMIGQNLSRLRCRILDFLFIYMIMSSERSVGDQRAQDSGRAAVSQLRIYD